MSYIDNDAAGRHKALTGGIAALIEIGLALALIKGFTVAFTAPEPPRHLPSQFFPTAPLPPDPVEALKPETQHPLKQKPADQSLPTATSINRDGDVNWQTTGTSTLGDDTVSDATPTVKPSETPARFTPAPAKPRNDIAGWVTTDDYPATDVRAGHTGTVRFQLAIDTSGRVASCTIAQSSGYPGLDAATCRYVTKRARFDPAIGSDGAKVSGTYSGTIRWVIPRD